MGLTKAHQRQRAVKLAAKEQINSTCKKIKKDEKRLLNRVGELGDKRWEKTNELLEMGLDLGSVMNAIDRNCTWSEAAGSTNKAPEVPKTLVAETLWSTSIDIASSVEVDEVDEWKSFYFESRFGAVGRGGAFPYANFPPRLADKILAAQVRAKDDDQPSSGNLVSIHWQ